MDKSSTELRLKLIKFGGKLPGYGLRHADAIIFSSTEVSDARAGSPLGLSLCIAAERRRLRETANRAGLPNWRLPDPQRRLRDMAARVLTKRLT